MKENLNLYLKFVILMLCFSASAVGQTEYDIVNINVIGNHKTNERVILNELTFEIGDKLLAQNVDSILSINKLNLINTSLFLNVEISYNKVSNFGIEIVIIVNERWYFLALPIAEFADRSINEWWYIHNHKLNRINFGLILNQKNLFGRKDRLDLVLQMGYSEKLDLKYDYPFLFTNKKSGLLFQMLYDHNKEIAYGISTQNQLLYLRQENYLRERVNFSSAYYLRPDVHKKHTFQLSYSKFSIEDSVWQYNPDYLQNSSKNYNFFGLLYSYEIFKTDLKYYPTSGFHFYGEFSFESLGIINKNLYPSILVNFTHYQPLNSKWNINNGFSIEYKKGSSSFLNMPTLGYEEFFIRAYEYYLVPGELVGLNRNELNYKVFDKTFYFERFKKISKFNQIPIQVYLKGYADFSYAYDQDLYKNYNLSNKLLLSSGVGIDIVSYYDAVFRAELGVNKLGEYGVFFHLGKGI